jgi:hypothetical protein
MHPVHDVDVLLLLSIAISSKRRPAQLADIIAASDLIHGSVLPKAELKAAFHKLSAYGLILQVDDGYVLTPVALTILSVGRKRADNTERLQGLKLAISAYNLKGDHAAILVTEEHLSAAMHEHQLSKAHAGKNLLVPKPKPAIDPRRRPKPARRKF